MENTYIDSSALDLVLLEQITIDALSEHAAKYESNHCRLISLLREVIAEHAAVMGVTNNIDAIKATIQRAADSYQAKPLLA